jgi:predicted transposase YbfD/YdcC
LAVYRQVHISFWQDPFIIELTPEEKYFYLYLMTNSKTKQCGCYEISKRVMVLETGYNSETIEKLLNKFVDYGKVEYNDKTNEILLKNWLHYNSYKSPKVLYCIEGEVKEIKHKPFAEYLADRLSIDYTYTMHTETQKEEEKEKEEEPKTKYASAVKMKASEYDKLIEKFGEAETLDRIERLSLYKQSTGKRYKCDYSTILAWARKDEKTRPVSEYRDLTDDPDIRRDAY